MPDDALALFKNAQKESWGLFAPLEIMTTLTAATLVNFSRITSDDTVLDVGCGTGVVAITAAKMGAKVSALDLSPDLIMRARENMRIAEVQIDLKEGDAENLPYPDHSFDTILSQYGHMFAPRPQVVTQEMLRVLKPGGTIAFSTWPPHLFVGRFFDLVAQYSPPSAFSPPSLWGDPNFVRQQLGDAVEGLIFNQGLMHFTALSLEHYLQSVEKTIGPVIRLIKDKQNDPTRLSQFRTELKALAREYYKDNYIHQGFLMTRARKRKHSSV